MEQLFVVVVFGCIFLMAGLKIYEGITKLQASKKRLKLMEEQIARSSAEVTKINNDISKTKGLITPYTEYQKMRKEKYDKAMKLIEKSANNTNVDPVKSRVVNTNVAFGTNNLVANLINECSQTQQSQILESVSANIDNIDNSFLDTSFNQTCLDLTMRQSLENLNRLNNDMHNNLLTNMEELERINQNAFDEFSQWSMDTNMQDSIDIVTPFEHGGHNMEHGNSFNNWQ